MPDYAWQSMRWASQIVGPRRIDLTIEGTQNLPDSGPMLIAAHHVHHLWDGVALVTAVPRPISIIVGLDWIDKRPIRRGMEVLCRSAHWPVINRTEPAKPVDPVESRRLLRRAATETLDLLRAGRPVVFFPEAYPNIDPTYTPKSGLDQFLPFAPGVVHLATMAARAGLHAPIVPVGFHYRKGGKWQVAMRIGRPMVVSARQNEPALLALLEMEVKRLSQATAV